MMRFFPLLISRFLSFYSKPFLIFFWLFIIVYSDTWAQNGTISRIDSLLNLVENSDDNLEKVGWLTRLSKEHVGIDPQKGVDFAQEAINLGKTIQPKPKAELAKAYNFLATSSLYNSQNEAAEKYYLRALALYKEIGDVKGQADIIGNLGQFHYIIAEYADALELQFRALELFEEVNDSAGISNTHSGIGNIYMIMGTYDKALLYDSLALVGFKGVGDLDGQAIVLGNMANILIDLNRPDLAKDKYNEAIEMYEKLGDQSGLARNLLNLSGVYEADRNYLEAFKLSNRALQIFRNINFPNAVAYSLGSRGKQCFLSYEDYDVIDSSIVLVSGSKKALLDSAIADFNTVLEITKEVGGLDAFYQVSEALTMAYEYAGNYEAALIAYKDFKAVEDSIYSIESASQIEKLTTEREVALKNKQIEIDRLAVAKKRNERIYFIIGIILLIGLLVFIYRNFKNQKRANLRLGKLNKQVTISNNLLEEKNVHLSQTLTELKETQDNLIESEKQKEKAQLRARISQDIHDDISSGLTKVSWLAETLKTKTIKDDSSTNLIDKINRFSREAVYNLGEIIWSTNPEQDNIESLLAYTRSYINSLLEDTPIEVQFEFPDVLPQEVLNPKLRRNLYLAIKEAVNNAMKYSQAKKLILTFTLKDNDYKMIVADNGLGFKENEVKGGGNGMRNMQRRMDEVNGKFHIESKEKLGTKAIFSGVLY